jgi:hypothetical protein
MCGEMVMVRTEQGEEGMEPREAAVGCNVVFDFMGDSAGFGRASEPVGSAAC